MRYHILTKHTEKQQCGPNHFPYINMWTSVNKNHIILIHNMTQVNWDSGQSRELLQATYSQYHQFSSGPHPAPGYHISPWSSWHQTCDSPDLQVVASLSVEVNHKLSRKQRHHRPFLNVISYEPLYSKDKQEAKDILQQS